MFGDEPDDALDDPRQRRQVVGLSDQRQVNKASERRTSSEGPLDSLRAAEGEPVGEGTRSTLCVESARVAMCRTVVVANLDVREIGLERVDDLVDVDVSTQ